MYWVTCSQGREVQGADAAARLHTPEDVRSPAHDALGGGRALLLYLIWSLPALLVAGLDCGWPRRHP